MYQTWYEENVHDEYSVLHLGRALSLIDSTIAKFKTSSSYLYLQFASSLYSKRWLDNLLVRNTIPPKHQEEYLQILSSPMKATGLTDAVHDLAAMKQITDNKKLEKAIGDYVQKYAWIGYDTGIGHNLTCAEVRDKIEHFKSDGTVQFGAKRKGILHKLKLTQKDKLYLKLMQDIIYLTAYRGEAHMRAGVHFRRVLEELANRMGTDYDTLTQFTLPEIKGYLATKKPINKELAGRRKDKFGVVMIDGRILVFSGNEVDALEENVELPEDLDRVSGMIACQGKVTGTARIVITRKDFDKVQSGDILISKMTTPEFMVVINRCSGMITDIGGITCHAAIVSRELKKPCIIGTKYATTFFHDGDLVELDALQGLAKKLS